MTYCFRTKFHSYFFTNLLWPIHDISTHDILIYIYVQFFIVGSEMDSD